MKYSDLFASYAGSAPSPEIGAMIDELAGLLVTLSQTALSVTCDRTMTNALLQGLTLLRPIAAPSAESLADAIAAAVRSRDAGGFSCFFRSHDVEPFNMEEGLEGSEGSLKALMFLALLELGAGVLRLRLAGIWDEDVIAVIYRGLAEIAGTFPYNYMGDALTLLGKGIVRAAELASETEEGAAESGDIFADVIPLLRLPSSERAAGIAVDCARARSAAVVLAACALGLPVKLNGGYGFFTEEAAAFLKDTFNISE